VKGRIVTTKSDMADYRDRLLRILSEQTKPLGITDIAKLTGRSNLNKLRSQLNWLAGEGLVIKLPGRGGSFTYRHLHRPSVEGSVQAAPEVKTIQPQAMAGLLRNFAIRKWESSTTKSSRAIPYCVRKLYEYAHDIACGGARSQADYDYVRSELQAFHDDLVNSLNTVKGMLETRELWDAKKSASWLLSAGGKSAEYMELANKAQEMQR
jgi:hypothetical protein